MKARTLLPTLGVAAAGSLVVSNMIGQGVFLKGRAMLCEVGSSSGELLAWAVAGVLTLCGALALAELAAMIPESGGIYAFLRRAYGRWAAFSFGWMVLLVLAPAAIGALGAGAAIFFNRLSGGWLDTWTTHIDIAGIHLTLGGVQIGGFVFIAIVTLINTLPTAVNGGIATIFAAMKIAVLAGITIAGFILGAHHGAPSASAALCAGIAANVRGGAAGFAAAVLASLYAFNGWQSVIYVAGEVKRPQSTLPRALIGGVGIVLILYVFANAAFLRVLGESAILALPASASLGVTVAHALFGPAIGSISAAIFFISAAATLHIVIFSESRVTYALARDGVLFAPLARVSRHAVPVRAVLATSGIAMTLLLFAGFDALSDYLIFNTFLFFLASVIALFVLRRKEPETARPYRVVGFPVVPAVFIVVSIWVLVQTLVTNPTGSLIGIAILLASIPVYLMRRSRGVGRSAYLPPA